MLPLRSSLLGRDHSGEADAYGGRDDAASPWAAQGPVQSDFGLLHSSLVPKELASPLGRAALEPRWKPPGLPQAQLPPGFQPFTHLSVMRVLETP